MRKDAKGRGMKKVIKYCYDCANYKTRRWWIFKWRFCSLRRKCKDIRPHERGEEIKILSNFWEAWNGYMKCPHFVSKTWSREQFDRFMRKNYSDTIIDRVNRWREEHKL